MFRKVVALPLCFWLAACSGVGPRANDIASDSGAIVATGGTSATTDAPEERFALVNVDRDVAFTVNAFSNTKNAFFNDPGIGRVTIQSGDVLSISLVSTNESGFIDFANSRVGPLAATPLPQQVVSETGTINVPPIGRVSAVVKTISQLENFLDAKLGEVLVNPAVVVEIVRRDGALVSVVGSVGAPGSFAYSRGDARLRDYISLAGGPTGPLRTLEVQLSREDETRGAALEELYTNARLNVHLRPGDVVSIQPFDRSVTVLGATDENETLDFDQDGLTLADALGLIGGPVNRRADPAGIFVYRESSRRLVSMLGVDTSELPGENVSTIFRFDLTEPTGFFTISSFEIEDGDLVYVANSRLEEFSAVAQRITETLLTPLNLVTSIDGRNNFN